MRHSAPPGDHAELLNPEGEPAPDSDTRLELLALESGMLEALDLKDLAADSPVSARSLPRWPWPC